MYPLSSVALFAQLIVGRPYFFIERAGRRTVMILSAAGCSFCMVMIAVMLKINTVAVTLPLSFLSQYWQSNNPNSQIGSS